MKDCQMEPTTSKVSTIPYPSSPSFPVTRPGSHSCWLQSDINLSWEEKYFWSFLLPLRRSLLRSAEKTFASKKVMLNFPLIFWANLNSALPNLTKCISFVQFLLLHPSYALFLPYISFPINIISFSLADISIQVQPFLLMWETAD